MSALNTVRAGVDWANKGYICMGAKTTDLLNLLPSPALWLGMKKRVVTAGTSTFNITDAADYGRTFETGVMWYAYTRSGAAVTDVTWFGSDGTNHSFPVTQNTTYTVTVYFTTSGNTTQQSNTTILASCRHSGTGTWTTRGSTTMDTSTSYKSLRKVTIQFTTGASETFVSLNVSVPTTGVTAFWWYGAMLTLGASSLHPVYWNDGQALSLHDDVTDYLKAAQWNIGRQNYMEIMPSEGSLTLTLENSTKKFSPEVSSSPLFGYMKSVRRVRLDYMHPDGIMAWKPLFTGWVEKYEVDTSEHRNREMTITAFQGLKNFAKMPVRRRYYENLDTIDWLYKALRGGYQHSGLGYKHGTIGKSYAGRCFVQSANDFASLNSQAAFDQDIQYFGHTWDSERDNGETLLREWADFHNGWVALDSYGSLRTYTYEYFDVGTSQPLNLSYMQDITYQYGGERWTAYRMKPEIWQQYGSYPSAVVPISDWSEWVTVPAGTTAIIRVPYNISGDYSTLSNRYGQRTSQNSEGRRTDDNSVAVTIDGTNLYYIGQQYDDMYNPKAFTWAYADRYYIRNKYAYSIDVRIQAVGVGFSQQNNIEYLKSSDAAALEYGYLEQSFANRMVISNALYNYYTNAKLAKRATDRGWYTQVECNPISRTPALLMYGADLLDLYTPTNDPQTRSGADLVHVIIGIAGQWTPNDLVFQLYLSPLF